MVRLRNKVHSSGKRAFTLVELIVVLVILAIIAAMVIPALTGYIKKAKRAKYIQAADEARVAAQAIMTELYGLGPGVTSGTANINNGDGTTTYTGGGAGADVRWDTSRYAFNDEDARSWGDRILNLMGRGRGDSENEPYIFVFGVGNPNYYGVDSPERYTVYYIAYVEDSSSPAIFYVNGEWIYKYPKDDSKIMKQWGSYRNTIVMNGVTIPLQYYVVSNRTNQPNQNDNFWTGGRNTLQGHSEGHYGY